MLAVSRSKKIFTLVHPWLQHPSTQQGCAKAAFHKVDDIAVGSTERADTQAGRQAGREHTCTDESLDIIRTRQADPILDIHDLEHVNILCSIVCMGRECL